VSGIGSAPGSGHERCVSRTRSLGFRTYSRTRPRSDSLSSRTATTATRAEGREAKNGAATASYLFGILSPLPFLGLLFGVAALFQGAQGLRYARRHPGVGGVLQCRIGMALGALFSTLYLVAILFLLTILY
jgi:hypothetical protein